MSRAQVTFVAVEVAAILAITFAPMGYIFPVGVPLLVVASLSRWLRGHGWDEVARGTGTPRLGLGRAALTGAIAGTVAIAIAAPLIGLSHVTALDWWIVPAARGGAAQLVPALAILVASAVALELSLRGWIIERVFELSPGSASVPIAIAAAAEALVTAGPLPSRVGLALFSGGLGLLYVACGRTVIAPIVARSTFVVGAVIVERLSM